MKMCFSDHYYIYATWTESNRFVATWTNRVINESSMYEYDISPQRAVSMNNQCMNMTYKPTKSSKYE